MHGMHIAKTLESNMLPRNFGLANAVLILLLLRQHIHLAPPLAV